MAKRDTTIERTSDRDLTITRSFEAPPPLVFEAWTTPALFRLWWTPKSFGLTVLSYEADIRTGGSYRLEMSHPSMAQPMAFFGRYTEVTPHSRVVWTNEESDDGPITTVTFEDTGSDTTRVVVHEYYPSKAALDEAIASGSTSGWSEQFGQLDGLLDAPKPG